jgi:hypothetical protein
MVSKPRSQNKALTMVDVVHNFRWDNDVPTMSAVTVSGDGALGSPHTTAHGATAPEEITAFATAKMLGELR